MSIEQKVKDYKSGEYLKEDINEKTYEVMVNWTNNKFVRFPFIVIHYIVFRMIIGSVYQVSNMFLGKWLNMSRRGNQKISYIVSILVILFLTYIQVMKSLGLTRILYGY